MKRAWLLACATAVAVAATGTVVAAQDDPPPSRELVIATGGPGGVYQAYGTAFARALAGAGQPATVRGTGASVENLRLVAAGEADIGFSLADSAAAAVEGQPPFAARLPVVALARLYDNYTHLVVPAGSPVRAVTDLRGLRVSTGAAESGTEVISERLLRLAGLDPDVDVVRHRLGVAESAQRLRDGRLQAFFWSGGLPTEAIRQLAATTQIRLVDLAGAVDALRAAHGEFYTQLSIPASAYGLGQHVATVGVPNYLVVAGSMADDTAYRVTSVLFDAKPDLVAAHPEARRLNPRTAISTWPVPLHPGASRYYREQKPGWRAGSR
ncbi:MAG TPA: TAXI family TRAP transporter solute-binding subunit [Pilimelia sp.]|nr:TAXI family TRAP transporter solute-binding subunit [Pilimelia sp.]